MPTVTKQTNQGKELKPNNVLARIVSVGKIPRKGIKIAIYGESGRGKTRFACTFPKPLLIIGSEDGTKSVSTDPGVDFVPIKESPEVRVLAEYVRDGGAPQPESLSFGKTYKSVVVDTATMVRDLSLREILGLPELPAQKAWGLATKQQYGQCAAQTKDLLRRVLDLVDIGIHVVVISQEQNLSDDKGGNSDMVKPYIGSALGAGTAGWLHPACDYVGQMFVRNEYVDQNVSVGSKVTTVRQPTGKIEFCLRTEIHEIYATKFRLPRGKTLPDVIVDPTFEKLVKLIT